MVTPGSAPPDLSRAVPSRLPVTVCATRGEETTRQRKSTHERQRKRAMVPPCCVFGRLTLLRACGPRQPMPALVQPRNGDRQLAGDRRVTAESVEDGALQDRLGAVGDKVRP